MATYVKIDNLTNDRFYELNVRNFGLGELKQISANIKIGNTEGLINILPNIIKDVEFDEICTGDIKNLILWGRVLTLNDNTIKVNFKCSDPLNKNCTYSNFAEEIELSNFERIKLSDDIKEVNELELSNGDVVDIEIEKVKHLTIQKELKKTKLKNGDEGIIKLLSLVNFRGKLNNPIDKYNFLTDPDNVTIGMEIDEFVNRDCFFGVVDFTFHKCPKCGGLSQVSLRFRPDSFTKFK